MVAGGRRVDLRGPVGDPGGVVGVGREGDGMMSERRLPHGSGIIIGLAVSALFWVAVITIAILSLRGSL